MRIINAKVDGYAEQLGVDRSDITFSWAYDDDEGVSSNVEQTAWRITVGTDASLAVSSWDSGVVESSGSLGE